MKIMRKQIQLKVNNITEIAKYNYNKQNEIVVKFQKLIKTEQNNVVKNVYIKLSKK